MIIKPETSEQIRITDWLRIMHPDIPVLAFAAERKCSPQYGALLKRMGVRAGVADLFFPLFNQDYNGLWIELKVGKNKMTVSQIKFLHDMRGIGYKAECCYGADEAIAMIKEFYGLK